MKDHISHTPNNSPSLHERWPQGLAEPLKQSLLFRRHSLHFQCLAVKGNMPVFVASSCRLKCRLTSLTPPKPSAERCLFVFWHRNRPASVNPDGKGLLFWMASWEEKPARVDLSCRKAVWGQAAHLERGTNRLSVFGNLDLFFWNIVHMSHLTHLFSQSLLLGNPYAVVFMFHVTELNCDSRKKTKNKTKLGTVVKQLEFVLCSQMF